MYAKAAERSESITARGVIGPMPPASCSESAGQDLDSVVPAGGPVINGGVVVELLSVGHVNGEDHEPVE